MIKIQPRTVEDLLDHKSVDILRLKSLLKPPKTGVSGRKKSGNVFLARF